MILVTWWLLFIGLILGLAYWRSPLKLNTAIFVALAASYFISGQRFDVLAVILFITAAFFIFLSITPLRRQLLSRPAFHILKKAMPHMSNTEREALEAGSVWFEGELFSGKPNWLRLKNAPSPNLRPDEQAFLDGPVEQLCSMLNDWQFSYEYADLPKDVYEFIHKNKFLAMIIPKSYGGLEFSAYAQSRVLTKVANVNYIAGNYITVPNSLGPGELLMKYGTQAQKDHYLPRLSIGQEIPCFGLTSPRAGSDASAITDTGVICKGMFEGKEIIGVKLNFSKRYITLAPVATVIGLAFKLYDPEHLVGAQESYGITCALIPRKTPGIDIGRRHFPVGAPFLNGPIHGHDVFIPLDYIIGGMNMAGKGWRMLVECLSVGRSVSLPSLALSGSKRAVAATGAYTRIRQQFNVPIAKFEGVQEALATMAAYTYIIDAAVSCTTTAIAHGAEPSVPSAILKYHCTELGRKICNHAMDIHGGKGAMKGPKNYLSWGYEIIPVAITVEGANILTRSLIIFGQGAIRCHPYIFKEMQAFQMGGAEGLRNFDECLIAHVGGVFSNGVRALALGLTNARLAQVPFSDATRRYYQKLERYSAVFALTADMCMGLLGGSLKFREMLSARLGDMLSSLYLTSMVLKHYADQGSHQEDLPIVRWACDHLLYQFEEQLDQLLLNLPVFRPLVWKLRWLAFPLGRRQTLPLDRLSISVAELITKTSASRDRLTHGMYATANPNNPVGELNNLLIETEALVGLHKKIRDAVKNGTITNLAGAGQITAAQTAGVINNQEAQQLKDYDQRIMENIIAVDDFAYDALGTHPLNHQPPVVN
ncbi:MAG: acyl-CoA dehydrogenase [Gammaproteobacteria bacterium]|nr:acyl-CoA dehydrogenase [Gammaproteobacteria bacterium]